jgi:Flp pilus assembly protein TadG
MRSDAEAEVAQQGMVTAELAVCLPVLMLLLGAALSMVSVAAAHIRAVDAAREAARAAARGDPAEATRLAGQAAPGVRLAITSTATEVTATATLHVTMIGSWLPSVTIVERAVAAAEPADSTQPVDSAVDSAGDGP